LGENLLVKTGVFYLSIYEGIIMTDAEYVELYKAERKNAVRSAVKILGGGYQADAEDCVQDAFMIVWKNRERIKVPAADYLFTVLKNECKKLLELSQPYDLCGTTEQTLKRAGVR
jgi:DNA-directed RNA polymerase specialized sigma24 family protein